MDEETLERVAIWPENDQGIERYIPQKERDSYDASDFAGPDRSFPITSQAQLEAAAHLIGHAADPAAVKAKAIRIAKRKGFSLPDSWKEGKSEDRAEMPTQAFLYAPIVRIDNNKREVEGVATSEAVDSYGTVFSYEASKRAFQAWIERTANVREMHERRAVGKGVGVFFDDEQKQVIVRSRVSKGAQDTWEKVVDGTLSGYSVGATNPVWDKVERSGKTVPYLVSYDLAELSLVDNASNPDGHGLAVCRADGLSDLVDITETEQAVAATPIETPEVERAGARISSQTQTGLHEARDHQIQGAMKTMGTCGCADCQAMRSAIDPDHDGDNDLTSGPADTDHDAKALANRVMELINVQLQAPLMRMQAIAGTFARTELPSPQEIDITPLQRSLDAITERLDGLQTQSNFDEVRASLEAVKGQVDRIAAQPVPGGPLLNGARPAEKRLATDPAPSYYPAPSQADLQIGLSRMQEQGNLDTQMKQLAAAALSIQRLQGRTGS